MIQAIYLDLRVRSQAAMIGKDERTRKNEIRNDYLKLAESGDDNLFMLGDVCEVF